MNTTPCKAELAVKDLKAVMNVADRMTRRRSWKHLNNVCISLNGAARVRWTNAEFLVQTAIPCDHSGPDSTIQVPAGEMLQVLRATKSKRVNVESNQAEPEKTAVSSGSISRELEPQTATRSTTNAKGETTIDHEIPEIPEIEFSGYRIDVAACEFIRAAKSLAHAVDPESSRYALGGMLFEFSAGSLEMVATDSRRLAIRQLVSSGPFENGEFVQVNPVVVPGSAIKTFIDLLPKKITGEVSIYLKKWVAGVDTWNGGYKIILAHNETALETPPVQGRFPRFQDVIPNCSNSAYVNRLDLLALMQEMESMQDDEHRGIDFKIAADLLTVRGCGANRKSYLQLPIHSPGHVKFTMDPGFVADALPAMESPEVVIEWIDGETAFLFRSPIPGIHSEVIMPLSRDR